MADDDVADDDDNDEEGDNNNHNNFLTTPTTTSKPGPGRSISNRELYRPANEASNLEQIEKRRQAAEKEKKSDYFVQARRPRLAEVNSMPISQLWSQSSQFSQSEQPEQPVQTVCIVRPC